MWFGSSKLVNYTASAGRLALLALPTLLSATLVPTWPVLSTCLHIRFDRRIVTPASESLYFPSLSVAPCAEGTHTSTVDQIWICSVCCGVLLARARRNLGICSNYIAHCWATNSSSIRNEDCASFLTMFWISFTLVLVLEFEFWPSFSQQMHLKGALQTEKIVQINAQFINREAYYLSWNFLPARESPSSRAWSGSNRPVTELALRHF